MSLPSTATSTIAPCLLLPLQALRVLGCNRQSTTRVSFPPTLITPSSSNAKPLKVTPFAVIVKTLVIKASAALSAAAPSLPAFGP